VDRKKKDSSRRGSLEKIVGTTMPFREREDRHDLAVPEDCKKDKKMNGGPWGLFLRKCLVSSSGRRRPSKGFPIAKNTAGGSPRLPGNLGTWGRSEGKNLNTKNPRGHSFFKQTREGRRFISIPSSRYYLELKSTRKAKLGGRLVTLFPTGIPPLSESDLSLTAFLASGPGEKTKGRKL